MWNVYKNTNKEESISSYVYMCIALDILFFSCETSPQGIQKMEDFQVHFNIYMYLVVKNYPLHLIILYRS